ncbi:MAG: (2Fe-2S) ferredoxin domain-containing protein [Magnetovibrio sp.]|nr:(2Fe-2S) ferredoxin domain-containing protein [Magnetovibrio sp.]
MKTDHILYVCINKKGGKACIGPKSREVFRALRKHAKERIEEDGVDIVVKRMECMGYCGEGPNVKIHGGPFFHEVTEDDADSILDVALKCT